MTRRNPAQRDAEELARHIAAERGGPTPGRPAPARRGRPRPERPPVAGRLRPHDSARAVPSRAAQHRTHRLALHGELRHDSAVQLEAEIDALCDAGVGTLVLDLADLRVLDATGARVISMRCALCRRRGVRVVIEGLTAQDRDSLAERGLLDELSISEPHPAPLTGGG